MRKFYGVICLMFLIGVPFVHARSFHTRYGEDIYIQDISLSPDSLHYDWQPGGAVCPLHVTNAIALAAGAVTNIVHDVEVVHRKIGVSFSPTSQNRGWYYSIRVPIKPIVSSSGIQHSTWFTVFVPLDGQVPEIRKANMEELKEKYKWLDEMNEENRKPTSELSPEEMALRREITRENLRQYQLEVIRAGMTPFPVPLTQEMKDQLVAEGILPPQSGSSTNTSPRQVGAGFRKKSPPSEPAATLTPEEEPKKRQEVRGTL